MWFKIFSIIPAVGEVVSLLLQNKRDISKIANSLLKLVGIAAPEADLPVDKIRDGATWTERAIADGVITAKEIGELGELLGVEVRL